MGKGSPEAIRRAVRAHHERNREKMNQKSRDYYLKNKEAQDFRYQAKRLSVKGKAGAKLRYAVWSGKIAKPNVCEKCNLIFEDKRNIHGHHHDYSKPFEVEWLCANCHGKSHRK